MAQELSELPPQATNLKRVFALCKPYLGAPIQLSQGIPTQKGFNLDRLKLKPQGLQFFQWGHRMFNLQ